MQPINQSNKLMQYKQSIINQPNQTSHQDFHIYTFSHYKYEKMTSFICDLLSHLLMREHI